MLTKECIYGNDKWAAPSEFGTYRLCEQRRFRRACASAQSRQNLRCSLIQAVNQEEPSDRKPDPWPLWMAGHAQLKFVMTECSKTQIRLTGLKWYSHMIRWQFKNKWGTYSLRVDKTKIKKVGFYVFYLNLKYRTTYMTLTDCRYNCTYEPRHDKTNKMAVRPAKSQVSLSTTQSDQSLCCPHEETLGP